eukprot:gene25550-28870_t
MAVQKTFPKVKVTVGPWIDSGFFYDFFVPGEQISLGDLKRIKKEMDRIIKSDYHIVKREVTRSEARDIIMKADEPFKLEILDSIKSEPITIYSMVGRNATSEYIVM